MPPPSLPFDLSQKKSTPPVPHTPTHQLPTPRPQELVLKRIRDGRLGLGLPTHGMDAPQLRALIDEQPHEAERIIKRDKRCVGLTVDCVVKKLLIIKRISGAWD